jgi:iron(III) transport system substrate-binding protein
MAKMMLVLIGLAGAGALAVTSCSSTSSASGTSSPVTSAKVPLVVYSAQGYDQAMTAAFQKASLAGQAADGQGASSSAAAAAAGPRVT